MKHLFYKGKVDRRNAKAMYEFLKNHFTYYTMNSWNGLTSIANKAKIYDLQLEGDKWLALGLLQNDDYGSVNAMIEQFEDEYPYVEVYFNGRSGGYIVLTEKKKNTNIIPSWILADDYEEFKQNCIDYYGSVGEARTELAGYVQLVEDFDKLCDYIRDYVNKLSLTNKEELLCEKLKEVVDDFNWEYGQDLKTLQIEPLKVEKDEVGYYINRTPINKSNSLNDCFDNLLDRFENEISLFQKMARDDERYDYYKVRIVYAG